MRPSLPARAGPPPGPARPLPPDRGRTAARGRERWRRLPRAADRDVLAGPRVRPLPRRGAPAPWPAQSLAEAQKAVGAKANFVAVNVNPGDTDGDINGFLRDNQAKQLALIRDTNARLLQAYQVTQLSTAVILNASGQVVYRGVDPTAAQIQSELAKVGAR